MPSIFDLALQQADRIIAQTMMSTYQINGVDYQAVYDETPREMDPAGYSSNMALNGAYRTLTLFTSQGYQPKRGDKAIIDGKQYTVTGFAYQDGYLILQVE